MRNSLMAPARKSRGVSKNFSHVDEVSPSKDGENTKKSLPRKRKLSDMLGLQWTKGELERFYDAYRKHGKDWKKVAVAVRNRSVEMVEALYAMNKAYLSLPEGTASVAGLIAMMTDHYCNMGGSDSEQESNDGEEKSRKPQKRSRGKLHPSPSKRTEDHTIPHLQPGASASGCLPFFNKGSPNGIGPRAVGKRTPRYPVSYSYERTNGEKGSPLTRKGSKLKVDAMDDDVAHEVALVLAEASQRGGSPQVSRTPNRGKYGITSSPAWNGKRMHIGRKVVNEVDEEGLEGSTEAENRDIARGRNCLREMVDVLRAESRKGKGSLEKTMEADGSGNDDLDDVKEACSGTEGQNLSSFWGKLDSSVSEAKTARSPFHKPKKKSKKVLFGEDERSPFDALQALADLATEDGSPFQVKDGDDLADTSPKILPLNHQKEKRSKSLRIKTKRNQLSSEYETWPKTSRIGKIPVLDVGSNPEVKPDLSLPISKVPRKKHKAVVSKTHTDKVAVDGHPSESQEVEVLDTGKKFMSKGKWSSNNSLLQKHGKLVKHPEHSSSSAEQKGEKEDSALSSMQVNMPSQANSTSKVRSRRKSELKEPQKLHLKYSNEQSNISIGGTRNIKEKLLNSMSNRQLRRWCTFEWFYSAIDYPWFAKREFVEYLNHVGLGHVPRLTRVEWGVIRSSLGKPRRFSEQFLREEKDKLNQYRDSVRTHYTELRSGTREGLPTDLAKPLSVGQRVVAIHPKTREIHDGSVLTVDHTRCRVQFDRPELGVEFVMDIDCMPQNPLENMPACMARSAVPVDKILENFNQPKVTGWLKDQKMESLMKFSSGENSQNGCGPHMSPSSYAAINLNPAKGAPVNVNGEAKTAINGQQVSNYQLSLLAQNQVKEADVQALADLTRALDKKEALVSELRNMNDDIVENRSNGHDDLENSELFKKQYAAILVQLHDVNEQVSSSLLYLRQRNGYHGNSILAWSQPAANIGDSCVSLSLGDHPVNHVQDSGSHVKDIVESSRSKARTLVVAAIEAMLSLNRGEKVPDRIEEIIDYVSNKLHLDDSSSLSNRPSTAPLDTTTTNTSSTMDSSNEDKLKMGTTAGKNECQIPSELISHCVATLLMIQKCTERQFPPTDVAQILDSAVTSLQPCCSPNIPVYSEIQKCMGIIKNQILALIPT